MRILIDFLISLFLLFLVLFSFYILYNYLKREHRINRETRWLYQSEGNLIQFIDYISEHPLDFKNHRRFVDQQLKNLKKILMMRELLRKINDLYEIDEIVLDLFEAAEASDDISQQYEKKILSNRNEMVGQLHAVNQYLIDDLCQIMEQYRINPSSWRLFLYNCNYEGLKIRRRVGKLIGKLMGRRRTFYIVEVMVN